MTLLIVGSLSSVVGTIQVCMLVTRSLSTDEAYFVHESLRTTAVPW
jgi:hypothetical protein